MDEAKKISKTGPVSIFQEDLSLLIALVIHWENDTSKHNYIQKIKMDVRVCMYACMSLGTNTVEGER